MRNKNGMKIPIESFLMVRDENHSGHYRIIYFDPRGKRYERLVDRPLLDKAIKILDGAPRSIGRSSGGLINSQPYKLVLYHNVGENENQAVEMRVKVRFMDFQTNDNRHGEFVTLTKVVLPDDLNVPFQYGCSSQQQYIVDFGCGILPLHVFAFLSHTESGTVALCVERTTLEDVVKQPSGNGVTLQRYKLPRDVLRMAREIRNSSGKTEFEEARQNLLRLRKLNDPVIPPSLKVGEPVELPSGISIENATQYLRASVHRWGREEYQEHTGFDELTCADPCITSDVVMYMEPA